MNSFLKTIFILSVGLASCMPKEEAVEPFDRGGVSEASLSSGALKNDVLFYDLENATLIATARPIDFDLSTYEGDLLINMFRYLKVAEFEDELASQLDTQGLAFSTLQDNEKQWTLNPETNYAIYMGQDDAGQDQGHYKLSYSYDGQTYQLKYAPINSTQLEEVELKEAEVYSMLFKEITDLPAPDSYDLIMGKYLHYFEVEEVEYEVFGAISPSARVVEVNTPFAQLDYAAADSLSFQSTILDEIGYDWKFYSLDKGAYEIVADQHFLIRNRNSFYFKFRFTNFYDGIGQSGHPSFEFQLL